MFPQGLILDISASLTMTSATIRDTAKTDLRSVLVSEPVRWTPHEKLSLGDLRGNSLYNNSTSTAELHTLKYQTQHELHISSG